MSTEREMDKEDVVHIHHGISLNHKKNEIMPFAVTWMDLEIVILSEVRDEHHMIFTCTCNLKYDTNEFIYKTETKSQI